jgi:hypothetical protein
MSRKRIAALAAVGLLIVVPVLWIVWSLFAIAAAREATQTQRVILAQLKERLQTAQAGEGALGLTNAELVYLPGETSAIAGAALQRIVGNAVDAAGGRIIESELAQAPADEADRVDIRVSFDAETLSLQRILFQLETGLPVLILRTLDVQSVDPGENGENNNPQLRVTMLVGGYWEARQ